MPGSDILSQDEIDALLSGVAVEEYEQDLPPPATDAARPYDFTSQDRIVRGRLPTLDVVNERLARHLRVGLFNLLRRPASVTVEPVEMKKFADYAQGLPLPSHLRLVKVRPLRGTALVAMSPRLVFALVESYFGGDGRLRARLEMRDFTATELRVAERVLEGVLAGLQKAWEPVHRVEFQGVGTEFNPQLAGIVSPSEVVVVSAFRIALATGGGELSLAMPYAMLEPIRELLDAGMQSDREEIDEHWSQGLREELQGAPVVLECTLARTEMRLREVLALEPGHVIALEIPETIVARVEGVPVFRARYRVSRGMRALELLEAPGLASCQGHAPAAAR